MFGLPWLKDTFKQTVRILFRSVWRLSGGKVTVRIRKFALFFVIWNHKVGLTDIGYEQIIGCFQITNNHQDLQITSRVSLWRKRAILSGFSILHSMRCPFSRRCASTVRLDWVTKPLPPPLLDMRWALVGRISSPKASTPPRGLRWRQVMLTAGLAPPSSVWQMITLLMSSRILPSGIDFNDNDRGSTTQVKGKNHFGKSQELPLIKFSSNLTKMVFASTSHLWL